MASDIKLSLRTSSKIDKGMGVSEWESSNVFFTQLRSKGSVPFPIFVVVSVWVPIVVTVGLVDVGID